MVYIHKNFNTEKNFKRTQRDHGGNLKQVKRECKDGKTELTVQAQTAWSVSSANPSELQCLRWTQPDRAGTGWSSFTATGQHLKFPAACSAHTSIAGGEPALGPSAHNQLHSARETSGRQAPHHTRAAAESQPRNPARGPGRTHHFLLLLHPGVAPKGPTISWKHNQKGLMASRYSNSANGCTFRISVLLIGQLMQSRNSVPDWRMIQADDTGMWWGLWGGWELWEGCSLRGGKSGCCRRREHLITWKIPLPCRVTATRTGFSSNLSTLGFPTRINL